MPMRNAHSAVIGCVFAVPLTPSVPKYFVFMLPFFPQSPCSTGRFLSVPAHRLTGLIRLPWSCDSCPMKYQSNMTSSSPDRLRVSFPCEPTGMQGAILNLCFIHHVCLAMTQQGVRQSITEGLTPWVGYGLPAVLVLPASSCRRYGDQYGRSLSGYLPISG